LLVKLEDGLIKGDSISGSINALCFSLRYYSFNALPINLILGRCFLLIRERMTRINPYTKKYHENLSSALNIESKRLHADMK
jgi:hypothetical protein